MPCAANGPFHNTILRNHKLQKIDGGENFEVDNSESCKKLRICHIFCKENGKSQIGKVVKYIVNVPHFYQW